jgi:hypothetical protein
MTSFFNKKEEVLDIQLTQFGKHLLGQGKFKPVYYAFYDSNILYDGAHGEVTEVQNDIEGRIQEDTAQPRTQHVFSSRARDFTRTVEETYGLTLGFDNNNDGVIDELDRPLWDEIHLQSTAEKHFSLVSPLGNSDLKSRGSPNWKITFLEGEYAQTASFYLTGTDVAAPKLDGVDQTYSNLPIPQISMNVTYVASVRSGDENAVQEANASILDQFTIRNEDITDPVENSIVFQDGSVVEVNFKDGNKDLLLMVEESGVDFEKENFEIEVYKIEPSGYTTQLKFKEEPTNVVDGLLINETLPEVNVNIDASYVEHYFDISVDSKINKKTICEAISEVKSKGIYVDAPFECEDIFTPTTISPYAEGTKDPLCPDE